MIFLKVHDPYGNPGLVNVEKILYISTSDITGDVKCRIHLEGGTENFADITDSYEDVITRLTALLER